ncbi:MAG TPA: hypothetical protein PKB14_07420 [Rubrivivax sp.]|nr:hypothetical protein [Rubrivivax sp.]
MDSTDDLLQRTAAFAGCRRAARTASFRPAPDRHLAGACVACFAGGSSEMLLQRIAAPKRTATPENPEE